MFDAESGGSYDKSVQRGDTRLHDTNHRRVVFTTTAVSATKSESAAVDVRSDVYFRLRQERTGWSLLRGLDVPERR